MENRYRLEEKKNAYTQKEIDEERKKEKKRKAAKAPDTMMKERRKGESAE